MGWHRRNAERAIGRAVTTLRLKRDWSYAMLAARLGVPA